MTGNNNHKYAFPQTSYNKGGMTLRDWFAGQALVLWANVEVMNAFAKEARKLGHKNGFEITASKAYELADAMLKEREK